MSNPHDDPDESRLDLGHEPTLRPADTNTPPSADLAGWLVAGIVFINEASFRNPDAEHFSLDYQILLRLAVCGCCGLYALKYWKTAWAVLDRFPSAWLLLFGAWGVATVPFAANVPYAAASCASMWCILLFAPVALIHLGPKRFFMSVFGSLAAFAVICWYFYFAVPDGKTEFIMPDGEIVYRLGGLTHANNLGRQMALMIIAGLALGSGKLVPWRKLTGGLILALVTLYFTNSRTSIIAAAVAALLTGLHAYMARGARERQLVYSVFGMGAIGAAALAVAAVFLIGSHADSVLGDTALRAFSRSGESAELYSFTGRTEIWQYAIDRIAESPIVGYGFGCSRFVMCDFEALPLNHAHNLLLNVMINMGVPGGILLLLTCLAQIRAAVFRPSAFPDMMIVMILFSSFSDVPVYSAIADGATLIWFSSIVWRPVCDQLASQSREVAE